MPDDCSDTARVLHLRELLGVNNLTAIPELLSATYYRRWLPSDHRIDPYVLFAWKWLCEKEAEKIQVTDCLNRDLLKEKVRESAGIHKTVVAKNAGKGICVLDWSILNYGGNSHEISV